jgi:hypothetical protein
VAKIIQRKLELPAEDRFAKLREKSREALRREVTKPDGYDAYMRRRASMMWNDPEWHSHKRPNLEIPVNHNLKFIAYINPVTGIELYFYRRARMDDDSSWYAVGKFKAIGFLDEACETLVALLGDVGGALADVSKALKRYVRENPYDTKKYADVEAWLSAQKK